MSCSAAGPSHDGPRVWKRPLQAHVSWRPSSHDTANSHNGCPQSCHHGRVVKEHSSEFLDDVGHIVITH